MKITHMVDYIKKHDSLRIVSWLLLQDNAIQYYLEIQL